MWSKEKSQVLERLRLRNIELDKKNRSTAEIDRYFDSLNEKLYFHEIERRDKQGERLQIPLAMLVAVAGFVGQMLQNIVRGTVSFWAVWFWIFIAVTSISFIAGVYHLIKILRGHIYDFVPEAKHWDDYLTRCKSTYETYSDSTELVTVALRHAINESFKKCWSRNAAINDQKSFSLQRLNVWLGTAALSAFLAYFVFYFGALDKGLRDADHRVVIVNPEVIKGECHVKR